MSDEKPLHVRVAEALGCVSLRRLDYDDWVCACDANASTHHCPGSDEDSTYGWRIYRYDTDWSATGPLIKPYTAGVHRAIDGSWNALSRGLIPRIVNGPDPLTAVCNLILVLASEGLLQQWKVSV